MIDTTIISICLASASILYLAGTDRLLAHRPNSFLQSLEKSPFSMIVLSFFFPLIGMSLLSLIYNMPFPIYSDEYGYILNADTFLQGRLSNPSPPLELHRFLATYNQFLSPTYNSKFLPGQGLILALGFSLSGQYVTGTFLAAALATASSVWLVQYFTTKPLFIIYTAVIASFIYCLSYWGHSYWEGCLSAFAGNLLLGASLRAFDRPQFFLAVLSAMGAWLLTITRPFEGLCLSAAIIVAGFTMFSATFKPFSRDFILKYILPGILLFAMGIGWNFYYFKAVTGNPMLTPYQWHHSIADFVPFWLLTDLLPEPLYPFPELKRLLHETDLPLHQLSQTVSGYLQILMTKAGASIEFFLIPGMLFLLVPGIAILRKEKYVRIFLLSLFPTVIGGLFSLNFSPHSLAPISGIYAISLAGVLYLLSKPLKNHRLPGRLAALAFCISLTAYGLVRVGDIYSDTSSNWSRLRSEFEHQIEVSGTKHIIIVRRPDNFNLQREWVYNQANLDTAPVIWARFIDSEGNKVLQHFFPDRQVWFLDIQTLSLMPISEYVSETK